MCVGLSYESYKITNFAERSRQNLTLSIIFCKLLGSKKFKLRSSLSFYSFLSISSSFLPFFGIFIKNKLSFVIFYHLFRLTITIPTTSLLILIK
jgi:hypothetical protein